MKPEFAEPLAKLADVLGETLTPDRIRIYAAALRDLSVPQLRRACLEAAQRCRFFPRPVELLQCAGIPTVEDRGLVMWATLQHAAAVAGAYVSVDIDDPAAAEALELVFGSWPELCAMEDGPALAMRRQEFLAAYRVAAARHPKRGMRRLVGLLPPPPPEVAEHTWVAKIEGSVVRLDRDRPQLEAHAPEARAIPAHKSET